MLVMPLSHSKLDCYFILPSIIVVDRSTSEMDNRVYQATKRHFAVHFSSRVSYIILRLDCNVSS